MPGCFCLSTSTRSSEFPPYNWAFSLNWDIYSQDRVKTLIRSLLSKLDSAHGGCWELLWQKSKQLFLKTLRSYPVLPHLERQAADSLQLSIRIASIAEASGNLWLSFRVSWRIQVAEKRNREKHLHFLSNSGLSSCQVQLHLNIVQFHTVCSSCWLLFQH